MNVSTSMSLSSELTKLLEANKEFAGLSMDEKVLVLKQVLYGYENMMSSALMVEGVKRFMEQVSGK